MNKPLPRSKFGKQYDENYERIFGKKLRGRSVELIEYQEVTSEEANGAGMVGSAEEAPAESSASPSRDAL